MRARNTTSFVLGTLLLATGWLAGPARAEDPPVTPAAKPAEEAQASARRPLLWMVEGSPRVFLYGTIHAPDPRVIDHLPVVRQALEQSTALYTELRLDMQGQMEMQQAAMSRGSMPPGNSLAKLLGDELHGKVAKYVPPQVPLAMLDGFKPWIINFMVLQHVLRLTGRYTQAKAAAEADESVEAPAEPAGGQGPQGSQILDQVLFRDAQAAGKKVGGLETIDVQIDAFDLLSLEAQVEMVRESVAEIERLEARLEALAADEDEGEPEDGDEGEDSDGDDDDGDEDAGEPALARMLDMWLAGDDAAFLRLFEEDLRKLGGEQEAFVDALLDKRNVGMALRICNLMVTDPKQTYFVAVGAGHMPGANGVVELLRRGGFEVRRIEAGTTIPPLPGAAKVKKGAGAGR
jgi:hypothetical protein